MAGLEAGRIYIFDDEALERTLASGTELQHARVAECAAGALGLTRRSKSLFLDAFPEEKQMTDNFQVIRKAEIDRKVAAIFADQLQNYPDIDTDDVQEKILLLALAKRVGAIVVTGEYVSITTRVKVLAEQVGAECINTDEFFELFDRD